MGEIFVCGDIHGKKDLEKLRNNKWKKIKQNLTKEDILIILGDFGFPWYDENHPKYKEDLYWINWLGKQNFTIAFLDGNHENFKKLNSLPKINKWNNEVHVLETVNNNIYHLIRGNVYEINKKNIFILGSAESHNVNKYKKDIDWWEEEKITLQDKENSLKNLKKYDFNVDYILTHNAPKLIGLILATQYANNYCNYNYKKSLEEILYKANDETARFLNEILYKIKAKESHFAHFHLDKIITKEDIENYQYYLNPFNEKQEDININYFECHYKNLPKKLL